MILRLIREPVNPDRTFGVLFIDGYFQCLTLENTKKIIPAGLYDFELYKSPKNKLTVPLLKDVPNRSYIEIHPANFEVELEGCIAVGTTKTNQMMLNSKEAFDKLMEQVYNAQVKKIKIDDYAPII